MAVTQPLRSVHGFDVVVVAVTQPLLPHGFDVVVVGVAATQPRGLLHGFAVDIKMDEKMNLP